MLYFIPRPYKENWQVIMHAFIHVFNNSIYQCLQIKPQSNELESWQTTVQTEFIMPPLCIPWSLSFLILPVSLIPAITSLQMRAERQHQAPDGTRQVLKSRSVCWASPPSILSFNPWIYAKGNNLWVQFLPHKCERRRMHNAHAIQNKALHCPAVRDHL